MSGHADTGVMTESVFESVNQDVDEAHMPVMHDAVLQL
jgi:hypothetical protein